jgi:hypothetical protein
MRSVQGGERGLQRRATLPRPGSFLHDAPLSLFATFATFVSVAEPIENAVGRDDRPENFPLGNEKPASARRRVVFILPPSISRRQKNGRHRRRKR